MALLNDAETARDLLAVPDYFLDWVHTKRPNAPVGRRMDTDGCPIGQFLASRGITRLRVTRMGIRASVGRTRLAEAGYAVVVPYGGKPVTVAPWVFRAITSIDLSGAAGTTITAGEVLTLLEGPGDRE